MLRKIFLYALPTTLLIISCGLFSTPEPLKTPTPEPLNTPTRESSASALPALDGEWTIKMTHSGGIMGLSRSIEVSSNGKFNVTDQRADQTVTGKFTANELSKIKEQVSSATYISPKPDGTVCADCFIYDLEIQSRGEKFAVQLSDINLQNSGLESLIIYLRNLLEEKLLPAS